MSRLLMFAALATAFAFARAKPYETKDCDSVADLIFVLDESTSIDTKSFRDLLEFVTNIVDVIDVGDDHTRVGVITYATRPRVIYRLSQSQTKSEVEDVVKSIQQARGDTYTDLALLKLHENMLSIGAPRRTGSRKVAVVITDGQSTSPEKTKAEAKRAQLKGVQIIAIGVGQGVDDKELEAIAGSDDRVFIVNDYQALSTIREAVVRKTCETPAPPPTTAPAPTPIEGCSGRKPVDQIWAVSNQAGVEETKEALNLIASTVSVMLLGPDAVQVGVAPRYGEEKAEIRLSDHDTHGQFFNDLELRELSGALTDRAIEYIRTTGMSPRNGARTNSVKYGILIVDNESDDWGNTIQEATLAKKANIRLIVIGVGQNVRPRQLRELAFSADDYLYVENYGALADLKTRIIERICQGII